MKLLLKKRKKLSPRANGQTVLLIPAELKQYFTTDEKVSCEYYQEGSTMTIKIIREA